MKYFLMALLLAGCIRETAENTTLVEVGDPVPDFEVVLRSDEGERKTTFSEARAGRPFLLMLVDFSCSTCARELADLPDVLGKLPEGAGYMVVARAGSLSDIAAQAFSFPVGADPNRAIFSLFATLTVPRNYVIAADGRVVYRTENEYNSTISDRLIHELAQETEKITTFGVSDTL